MTTRTKIGVGVVLLVVALLVVLALPGSGPEVSLNLVSYTSNSITLSFTNWGRIPVDCIPMFSGYYYGKGPPVLLSQFTLAARSSTQLVASVLRPEELGKISVACVPIQGPMRNLTDDLLRMIGLKVAKRNFFVTVDLPPR